ncbi:unnamed protein product, partial [Laminaria digitata]
IGECRSSTHIDGGKSPVWQNMSRSVFTFYVPSTITLDHLTLSLDVINENRISDGFIGTTGSIGIDQVADGSAKWWNVSTGGTLQTIIELVTDDTPTTHPNSAYQSSSITNSNRNNNSNSYGANSYGASGGAGGGGRVAVINPSPHVAVAQATPAPTSSMYRGGAVNVSAQAVNVPPTYEAHTSQAPPVYRPPPVAPGATASAKYDKPSNYNNSTTTANYNNNNNGGGGGGGGYAVGGYGDVSSLPQARAVPVYDGPSPDDPYNARGASLAAAATASSTSMAAVALANTRADSGGGSQPRSLAPPGP